MDVLDTLALFGAAALATPIGLLGIEFLVDGRTLAGAAFLAVSGGLVAGVLYRPDPLDVVGGTALEWFQGANDDADADAEGE